MAADTQCLCKWLSTSVGYTVADYRTRCYTVLQMWVSLVTIADHYQEPGQIFLWGQARHSGKGVLSLKPPLASTTSLVWSLYISLIHFTILESMNTTPFIPPPFIMAWIFYVDSEITIKLWVYKKCQHDKSWEPGCLCLCLWLCLWSWPWLCLWSWPWLCLWHAYVGPWHMLNNFCFHV